MFESLPGMLRFEGAEVRRSTNRLTALLGGDTRVVLECRGDGGLRAVELAGSELTHALAITLRAVFKRPEGISGTQVSTHEGVVNWKLPDSMTIVTNASPQRVASAVAPEKKVCKKTTRTGSLVATERVCMTPSQWKRQSDEARQIWEESQGRKGSTSGQ